MKHLIIILLLSFTANCQEVFQRAYYTQLGSGLESAIESSDQNLTCIGRYYYEPNNTFSWLMKIDQNGDTLWNRFYKYDGTSNNMSISTIAVSEGASGYGIVGNIRNNPVGDSVNCLFLSTDLNGNLIGAKSFGTGLDDEITDIISDTDSTYMLIGIANEGELFSQDRIYLLRVNLIGDTLWTKTYFGTHTERLTSIIRAYDGTFVITGYTLLGFGPYSPFIMKIDAEGNLLWHKSYNKQSGGTFKANHILELSDKGFLVTGETNCCGFVFKTDSLGNAEWCNTFFGAEETNFNEAIELDNGNFMVTGLTWELFNNETFGNSDLLWMVLSPEGNMLWNNIYGSVYREEGRSIIKSADGGMFLLGSGGGYIVKIDQNGTSGCREKYLSFNQQNWEFEMMENNLSDVNVETTLNNIPIVQTQLPILDTTYCKSQVGLDVIQITSKQLIRITDLLGRETPFKPNTPLIYIYSDGTTEKVYRME